MHALSNLLLALAPLVPDAPTAPAPPEVAPPVSSERGAPPAAPHLVQVRRPATGRTPADDGEWVACAREHLETLADRLAIEPETLLASTVRRLALASHGSSDKVAVSFEQELAGHSVLDASVCVLLAADGALLAVESQALPAAASPSPIPAVPEREAVRAAGRAFGAGGRARVVSSRLVVAPPADGGDRHAHLAWCVELAATAGAEPHVERLLVAADGVEPILLGRHSMVHRAAAMQNGGFSADGRVVARATPGTRADGPGNAPVFRGLPGLIVATPFGVLTTDEEGVLPTWPITSQPIGFSLETEGLEILNAAGPAYTRAIHLTGGPFRRVRLNNPADPEVTAQVNVLLATDRLRDWVRDLDQFEGRMDQPLVATVNAAGSGPWTTGSSVFFTGPDAAHRNSAFSTLIVHELGHVAVERFGNGNGTDGFGEGVADALAMYVYDTPLVGDGWAVAGGALRDGENLRQFCGDGAAPCHGSPHLDGEVLMGALWKVRRNLQATLGTAAGGALADRLLLAWLQAFNGNRIHSEILDQWLLLDDDDGDLSNGTPHFSAIHGAFLEHGFPGLPGQTQLLTAASPESGDKYGKSVAIDDTRMVVGPHGANPNGQNNRGLVDVYELVDSVWSRTQTVTAPLGQALDEFGYSVALSFPYMVVGAVDAGADGRGRAWLFTWNGGTWQFTQELSGGSVASASGLEFGAAVDVDGATVVVGSRWEDVSGSVDCGAVYVFEPSGGLWVETARLVPADNSQTKKFGISVSLGADLLVVGAHGDDQPSSSDTANYGAVYVFDRASWTQQARFAGTVLGGELGKDVAASPDGQRFVAGAWKQDGLGAGAAFVFARTGPGWALEAQLQPVPHPGTDARFGVSVAFDGDRAIVGANGDDGGGLNGGSAWLFTRTGTSWSPGTRLITSGVTVQAELGFDVAIDGDAAAAGAYTSHAAGPAQSGAVHAFTLP